MNTLKEVVDNIKLKNLSINLFYRNNFKFEDLYRLFKEHKYVKDYIVINNDENVSIINLSYRPDNSVSVQIKNIFLFQGEEFILRFFNVSQSDNKKLLYSIVMFNDLEEKYNVK